MDYDPERSEQSNVTMSEGPLESTTCHSLAATIMQPPREVVLLMDAISILNLGVELILPASSRVVLRRFCVAGHLRSFGVLTG